MNERTVATASGIKTGRAQYRHAIAKATATKGTSVVPVRCQAFAVGAVIDFPSMKKVLSAGKDLRHCLKRRTYHGFSFHPRMKPIPKHVSATTSGRSRVYS